MLKQATTQTSSPFLSSLSTLPEAHLDERGKGSSPSNTHSKLYELLGVGCFLLAIPERRHGE